MKRRRAIAVPKGVKQAAVWLKWPVLGFLLCGGQVAGMYAPFALAAVAAAGIRLPGLSAVLGVAGGAFAWMDFQSGLRCTAVALMIFAANTALYDTALYRKAWFRPVCTAGFFLLVQSIYLLGRDSRSWLLALCAAAAAAPPCARRRDTPEAGRRAAHRRSRAGSKPASRGYRTP